MPFFFRILLPGLLLLAAHSASGDGNGFRDLRGQVIVRNEDHLFLRTTNGVLRLHFADRQTPAEIREGDRIRIRGTTGRAANRESVSFGTYDVDILDHDPLPEAVEVPGNRIPTGEMLYQYVFVRGVIASVRRSSFDARWNWIVLRTPTGSIGVTARESSYPMETLLHLVDTEVRVRGFVSRSWTDVNYLGAHLALRGDDALTVLVPAPDDPFSAPPFTNTGILHRQRMRGTVLAAARRRFVLRSETGRTLLVNTIPGEPPVRSGQAVTVVGFVEPDPIHNRIVESRVRLEPDAPPSPIDDPLSTEPLAPNLSHGKTVRLDGYIRQRRFGAGGDDFRLETDGESVLVDVSGLDGLSREDFALGARVQVSGVCLVEFERPSPAEAFPVFRSYTLIPRTPADLVVLETPPWWTPRRFLFVLAALVAALVAILIWNRLLQTLSRRRGRALAREELGRAQAEWKVEERTRLAVELHDAISQTLTGVALQIDAARGSVGNKAPAAARFLETARAMLASCRQELRCCIWDLRSRTFEEKDMTEAVRRTVAPHVGDIAVSIRFNVPRERLSEPTTHDVLRIVRELVVNAIRHGRATQIRIAGECRDGFVRFSVRDDGCGFDPKDAPGPQAGHFGLQGIRERIEARNGTLTLDSSPGHGTKAVVTFPSEEDNVREE